MEWSRGERLKALHMVIEGSELLYVGTLWAASTQAGQGRSVQPLSNAETELYVAGGCPALAARLGLRLPEGQL